MYCSQCGNADQQPDSYCRNCGEFVTDYAATSRVLGKILGGSTPSTQINVNLAINLLTLLACSLLLGFLNGHYDALRAKTGEAPPTVIYLVYAFLLTISAWQVFSLVVSTRLRSKLGRKKTDLAAFQSLRSANQLGKLETRKLPTRGETPRTTPLSVTEEATKILNPTSRS